MSALRTPLGALSRRTPQLVNALPSSLHLCSRPSSTAAPAPTTSSPSPISPEPILSDPKNLDLSKAKSAFPLNPREVYDRQVAALRKQYREESEAKERQKEEEKRLEAERREAKRIAFEAEVAAFRAARGRDFSEDGIDRKSPTAVDDIAPEDPIVEDRKAQWRAYARERQQKKFEHFVGQESRKAYHRVTALMYLYHAAADFVTYENMDQKIEQALQAGGISGGVRSELSLGQQREIALKDVMLGTIADGKIGPEDVARILEENGGSSKGGSEGQSFLEWIRSSAKEASTAPVSK
ncbi:hypothetical protein HDV00_009147 [Rhizophlyctis rosea]|nr:hypothetical protein HDV00_009147 [Rhizophlyctis rosea]